MDKNKMAVFEFIDTIETEKDFVAFLRLLQKDYHKNMQLPHNERNNNWENYDLASYFDAMGAVADALDGYIINNLLKSKEPSWKLFAIILYAASIYE